jgi:hypothetical protein
MQRMAHIDVEQRVKGHRWLAGGYSRQPGISEATMAKSKIRVRRLTLPPSVDVGELEITDQQEDGG